MKPVMPMAHLTTVSGSFHAKVVAARLGAEGIPAQLRGGVDGMYPIFDEVMIYVRADQVNLAREVLQADAREAALGDAVDAVFDDRDLDLDSGAGMPSVAGATGDLPDGAAAGHGRMLAVATVILVVILLAVGYMAVTGH